MNYKNEYNPSGGETGFDSQEAKLPTYWNTSFSKICLGMKIGQKTNFIAINKQANSPPVPDSGTLVIGMRGPGPRVVLRVF